MYSSGTQAFFLGFAATLTDAEIMDVWIILGVGVPPEKYFAGAVSGFGPAREDEVTRETE